MLAASNKAEQADILLFGSVAFIALVIFLYIFARTSMILVIKLSAHIVVSAAEHQMDYISKHSQSYFLNRFAGSINGKVTSASDGLQGFVNHLFFDAYGRIIAISTVIIVTSMISYWFAAVFLTCVILVIIIDVKMVRSRKHVNKAYSEANVKYRGKSVDILSNISAVRQYSRSGFEMKDLYKILNNRCEKLIKQIIAAQQIVVVNNIIVLLANIGVLVVVYFLFKQDQITIGQIVLVITLLGAVNKNVNGIGNLIGNLGRQYVDIQNGLEDIYKPHEIKDLPKAQKLKVKEGSVIFSKVTFSYEEKSKQVIFKNLDLRIEPGQRIGLVGPSGAGKSTLISLLLRQYDIDSGSIEIDIQNIAEVKQDSLRQNIAVVPQEPLLFHRSIKENILYGKTDATKAEMVAVAKKAQAHSFIEQLTEGYDTLVGERGVKLSGGQKQRIAIARAMLKQSSILVLDEATSALDSESEVLIQKALEKLMVGKTVIAIAHRLSTLRKMDRIIVLNDGKIIEDGSHDTLVKARGLYSKLWEHQAGGFIQE